MAHIHRFPLVSLVALSFAMPALAQNTPAPPAPAASGPQTGPQTGPAVDREKDVVVVTAQKREETVQDIPLAVTAITDTMRDQIGLTSLQDFTNFAPGLTYSVRDDRVGMRGVNRNTNNFGVRIGISNYTDGFYYPSTIPGGRSPAFIERVEVVRGPQGTLYGRDSIAGAINIISKRPSDDFEAQVNIGAGSYESWKFETSVSGPINDSLRYRVNGSVNKQDEGFLINKSGLETEGNRDNGYYYEGQLEGNIGENFEWFLRGAHSWWERIGSPGARSSAGVRQPYDTRFYTPGGTDPNAAYGYNAPGGFTQRGSFIGNPTVSDPWAFNADWTGVAKIDGSDEALFEGIYHASAFDVKYLGGYGWYKYNHQIDFDDQAVQSYRARVFPFSPAGTLTNVNVSRIQDYTEQKAWFSNEVNLISTYDGPIQYIFGLYQYQENYLQPVYRYFQGDPVSATTNRALVNPATGGVVGLSFGIPTPTYKGHPITLLTSNSGINSSYGVFTQWDWQMSDQFKMTAGLRYSEDYAWGEEKGRVMCYYTPTCALGSAASPGLDVTDTGFFGAVPSLYPNGSPGVVGASAANPSGSFIDDEGNRHRRLHDTWSAVTGMARIDWTPNPDTLVFANYARGYKGGGFNQSAFSPVPRVDKETIDSYELGWKQDLRQLNLTFNADAFYYDYKGYQVPNTVVPLPDPTTGLITPYTAFVNIPKVETTGFELETTWAATDNLRFIVNYGYVNPEIKEASGLVDSADPLARLPGAKPVGAITGRVENASGQVIDGQVGQDLSGNILPFTSKNKVSATALYSYTLENGQSLTVAGTYNWQDSTYSTIFNRFTNQTPNWDQFDTRVTWSSSDGRWTLIGYIKNLFDETQYDGRGAALRRANAVAGTAVSATGVRTAGTGRTIPQTLVYCGSTPATTIDPTGDNGNGFLAESCITSQDFYRQPRFGGVELQFRF
jgi:iron complex outermembrane receptor protein